MRFIDRVKLFAAAAIVMLCVPINAQRETIPELVARGSVGSVATVPSGPTPSMAGLLREADVIVAGLIGEARSYLSADQRDIYTDYSIKDPTFYFQSKIGATRAPGVLPTVAITQRGGTVLVNGTPFTERQPALPPLQPGTRGLFVLQQIGDKYFIAGMYFGAFSIQAGTVMPLTAREDFAPEYRNVPMSAAVDSMIGISRSLGRSPAN